MELEYRTISVTIGGDNGGCPQRLFGGVRNLRLCLVVVASHRAVLGPDIEALPVELRGVVVGPRDVEQLLVA